MVCTGNTVIILIGMIALLIIAVMFVKNRTVFENFDTKKVSRTLNACPNEFPGSGSPLYYNKKGDGICCSTKPDGNTCKQPLCALSGKKGGLKSCFDLKMDVIKEVSRFFCPSKLPNGYGDLKTLSGGCTDSPVNSQLTAPRLTNANKCKMYLDSRGAPDDKNPAEDNCITQKLIEIYGASCFGTECQSFKEYVPSKKMNLFGLKFTDTNGQRRTCYHTSSYADYIGTYNGLDKSSLVCSNARGAFVDRTIDPKSLTA
jgi:hypothetical protein